MAKLMSGILGGFKGRVGPVSGYERCGQDIMRTSRNNVVDKPTLKRIAQREKIIVCNIFANAFKKSGFFAKSFPAHGHEGTGYNRAMGVLMNLALTGTYPDISLHYPKVLISKGTLPPC